MPPQHCFESMFQSTSAAPTYKKYNVTHGSDLLSDDAREPSTVTLIVVPWLIFVAGSVLFTFLYTIFPMIVWLLMFGALLYAVRLIVKGSWGGRAGTLTLGIACFVAVVLCAFLGRSANKMFLEEYWRLERGTTYNNVLPSESAMAHDDAAVLIFTEGTIIDTSRANGYKTTSGIYCVAPILNALDFDGRVEYWAVGSDCCHAHGDFTCDNANDPNARSGIVLGVYPGPPTTTPPATSLTLEKASTSATTLLSRHQDMSPEWVPAIRAAEATFGVVAAERALLVRWSSDPSKHQGTLLRAAAILLIGGIFVHLLVSCAVGCVVGHAIWKR